MILVGVDEAGYGPTLGPLVVSAAAFRFPDPDRTPSGGTRESPDLWSLLEGSVTRKPDRSRIPVNDSKKIYRPGKGLRNLEEGILPFLGARDGSLPADFRELLRRLLRAEKADAYLDLYPWYRGGNIKIPTVTFANYLRILSDRLRADLDEKRIRFLGLASECLEVVQFNRALSVDRSKALVSFSSVGRLLARAWRSYSGESIEVVVDRQGGRIHYAPLLFKALKPLGIQIECQTAERSVYRLRKRKSAMRVTFTREGDSKSFPVALASMTSKYIRELHMNIFNRFWGKKSVGLRPTAGYPTDAVRFLKETADLRKRLGIADDILIRRR